MSSGERIRELIRRYAEGPRLLEEAVAGIPEDELRFSPGPSRYRTRRAGGPRETGSQRQRFPCRARPDAQFFR